MIFYSTTVQLPDPEVPVIVVRNGRYYIGEIRWDYPNFEDTYESYMYWDDANNDGQDWEFESVTHWAELPILGK